MNRQQIQRAAIVARSLPEGRPMEHAQTLQQIGLPNIWAISGGPWMKNESSIVFPVGRGWYVTVTLDASDTYTVRRIFLRGSKVWVKGEWSDIYCEEIGDIAYHASCWNE